MNSFIPIVIVSTAGIYGIHEFATKLAEWNDMPWALFYVPMVIIFILSGIIMAGDNK